MYSLLPKKSSYISSVSKSLSGEKGSYCSSNCLRIDEKLWGSFANEESKSEIGFFILVIGIKVFWKEDLVLFKKKL